MGIKTKSNKVAARQPHFKTNMNFKSKTKTNKITIMKIIREHCTADHIKDANNEYDFRKLHSRFNFPKIKCPSENSHKTIRKYFNRKRYKTDSTNEFKRTAAMHLASKIIETPKESLLNYPTYKYYDKAGKGNPNFRYLCETLVSKHLVNTITIRRNAWVNNFKYNFHQIGDFSKSLLDKHKLAENYENKYNALLGLKCHQRGIEPYFPSTSFISGSKYNYSNIKDKYQENEQSENKVKNNIEEKEKGNMKGNISNKNIRLKKKILVNLQTHLLKLIPIYIYVLMTAFKHLLMNMNLFKKSCKLLLMLLTEIFVIFLINMMNVVI